MIKYVGGAFLVFFLMFGMTSCSKVPAGNVGIIVHLLGGSKGVDSEEVGVGRYWLGWNDEMFLFPTFLQNYVWTADKREGSPENEEFTFQTREGLVVKADIGISYSVNPKKVSEVFQKYRRGIDEITHVFLRNQVRDALVSVASTKPIEYVYGEGKADLIKQVEQMVREENKDLFDIQQIYWIGELRLPESVVEAINLKITATQKAAQRENEIQTAKASAQVNIEEARGKAESQLAVARAEAEAVRIRGDAEADAINAKSKALNTNPQLVQYEIAQKWNGVLPEYTMGSSSIPMLNLPAKQ
jgi:regulator of protease activity HflC (stomatin/prohibitin superfamily)